MESHGFKRAWLAPRAKTTEFRMHERRLIQTKVENES